MEEILEKLLTSDLLSEETRSEISLAWAEAIQAKTAELKEEATLVVRAELAQQFVEAREALVEKVEAFVAEQLEKEITELKGDVERFRDVEAEFAGKLVEEKQKLAEQLEQEIDALVDKIDAFLEMRLAEEIEEIKEDLEVVKQNDFGRRVFEAFVSEFGTNYVDEDSVQTQLAIAESKLTDATARLQEIESEKSELIREQKMQEVLKPLSGSKREQMQFVLQNVSTEKLDEAYKQFIGRVLKEEVAVVKVEESVLATGDGAAETVITEEQSEVKAEADKNLAFIKRIAGIRS